MRVNLGCGHYPLAGWLNLDADRATPADLHASIPPLPWDDASVDEVYAGHLLEHFPRPEGLALLRECWRVLVPGGRIGVVVPDTRAVLEAYVAGDNRPVICPPGQSWQTSDLDHVAAMFLYSTVQDSPHRWSYDLSTLARLLARAGFRVTGEIDRFRDPRIPVAAWYQCGLNAVKGDR